ncbi:CDP-alcohol phosphatidyltransferase family protein [Marinobacter flavimaris]|uniref:CDP-alcohol phosphatidyltransferase family protein n=1 Tax=Marinobacter flavimaris TaxID=262076 RepID=A0A3D8H814_9GAMM|nr:CDP-alcohol phosphatidyltransferase family protein [Marinobacter flavimaris]PPI82299.1 CDP-alcohol phosphatidyltransferase [Marinobacter flavimaris]RDU42750.1 CDP-alcohol phosphatidyltransferase family protein [Marinobacter flavimaris]
MDSNGHSASQRMPLSLDLVWGSGLVALFCAATGWLTQPPVLFYFLAAALYLAVCALIIRFWPETRDFGWANRATLLRGSLVIVLVALAPFADHLSDSLWLYGWMALLALVLDGVDGKVARATDSQSEFGARFDMELDALFILGLSVAVLALGKAGPWVLALGLIRYAFVIATHILDWLNAPLPESFRRKTVCVWQIVTLLVAVLPPVNALFASITLATALALLVWSFFLDIHWLYQRRHHHDVH